MASVLEKIQEITAENIELVDQMQNLVIPK